MCRDVSHEAIVLAAYGELGAARLEELKEHLRTCAACAEQARDVQSSRELVARAEGHALPEPWLVGAHPGLSDRGRPPRSRFMRVLPTASLLAAAAILVAALVVFTTSRHADPVSAEARPQLASGSLAVGAVREDAYLGDDGLGDEIEWLQSELTSLESKMGEF